MSIDLRIALLNVFRQKGRSLAVGVAVLFGVAALILANSFIEWLLFAMRETTIRSQLGHIQITRPGFHERGRADPLAFLLAAHADGRKRVESTQGVSVVAPRILLSGLVSKGELTVSFIGEGVSPAKEEAMERSLLTLSQPRVKAGVNIVAGTNLSEEDSTGILIGEGLARNLGVQVGEEVVLITNTASGGINGVEGRVRGTFSSISKAYDDSAVRLPLELTRKLMKVQGEHVWTVLLDRTEDTEAMLTHLRKLLVGGDLEATPWTKLADFYNKTAQLFARQASVVTVIIAVIIVLSVSNALMMSVLERTAEIGTSLALGVRRKRVLVQFLLEGAILGLLGGLGGAAVGVVAAGIISTIGIPMPPPPQQSWGFIAEMRVTARIVVEAVFLAMVTSVVAAFVPALRAARLPIVDSLRAGR